MARRAALHGDGHPVRHRQFRRLAAGPPGNPDAPIPPQWADVLELAFTLLFTSEMLIKMVAMGLACHRGAYLSDNWNRLIIVVLLGWLPYILPSSATCSDPFAARLRPLRSISVLPGVKRQATTLLDSMLKMADVPCSSASSRAVWSARRSALQGHALYRCYDASAPPDAPPIDADAGVCPALKEVGEGRLEAAAPSRSAVSSAPTSSPAQSRLTTSGPH